MKSWGFYHSSNPKPPERINKRRKNKMKDLIDAAIKSTRSPSGVDRCVDLLIRLKSLSLSVKDILYFSKSIFKLETLRRHRNPKIREVSQSLFTSLLKTLYSQ
uniref:Transcription elongation factor TFIIS/CRSP70 N-terminal sub-type domain-containing protein n=1 Tax=Brassica oleracea var. oleracea TaxID=109376 RepID=A0A0D3BSU5_BRAOL